MSDFKLKNEHKSRALKLAVSKINAQQNKPLYDRRDSLTVDIAMQAHSILLSASARYLADAALLDARVYEKTDTLQLGKYADALLGQAVVNPELGGMWHVITNNLMNCGFIRLSSAGIHAAGIPLLSPVANFSLGSHRIESAVIPSSSLFWVLNSKIPGSEAAMGSIMRSLKEIEDVLVPAILAAFAVVPEIAQVIGRCQTYSELILAFPAAAELFVVEPDPSLGGKATEALGLLKKIS